jgi:NADH-quinone oxidoreductase subunit C
MLLEKIKDALKVLYEDMQESPEIPEEAVAEKPAGVPAEEETSPAAEARAEEDKAAAGEAPAPPGPRETDYKAKGYHLDVALPPDKIVAAAAILNSEDFFLEAVTGVDWIAEQQLEVVYDFNHFAELCRVVLRSRLDRSNPEIPTISHIYQGANWHERETHDFFGIIGHRDPSPQIRRIH